MNAHSEALNASHRSIARLRRWKLQAGQTTAARGTFPYPHPTVKQWTDEDER